MGSKPPLLGRYAGEQKAMCGLITKLLKRSNAPAQPARWRERINWSNSQRDSQRESGADPAPMDLILQAVAVFARFRLMTSVGRSGSLMHVIKSACRLHRNLVSCSSSSGVPVLLAGLLSAPSSAGRSLTTRRRAFGLTMVLQPVLF